MVKISLNARNIIIGLSLILYLVSLFCPMYYADISNSQRACYSVSCFETFIIGILSTPIDLFFLLCGDFDRFLLIWVINIPYFYNLYYCKRKTNKMILIIVDILSMIAIVSIYFWHPIICYARDAEIIPMVGDKGIGYFLWAVSLFIIFLWCIFSSSSEQKKGFVK